MKSSATEPKSQLSLADVVISLMRRDRLKEAVDWVMEAVLLGMTHDVDAEKVLRMPADRVIALLIQPPKAEEDEDGGFVPPFVPQVLGWDNVYYGDPRDWREE